MNDTPRRTPPRGGEKALPARSASEGSADSRCALANALAGASGWYSRDRAAIQTAAEDGRVWPVVFGEESPMNHLIERIRWVRSIRTIVILLRASVRRHRRASRVASGPGASAQLSPLARACVRRLAANRRACDGAGQLGPAAPASRPGARSGRSSVTVPSPHPLWGTGNSLPRSLPAPRWGSARTIRHLGPIRSSRVRCTGTGSAPIGAFLGSLRDL
jgi:hypothetical protein